MTHTHAKPHIQAQTDTLKVNNSITITVETNAIKLQITMASNKKNLSVTGTSTAELILDGLDNNDITVMSPEESSFSKQNMGRAIEYLSPFLLPEPTTADKNSFDYTKFHVVDTPKEELQKFIEQHIGNGTVLSMETILLAVECVTRSGDPVKKAICRLDENKQSSGVQFVFKKWLSYAISIMEKRRKGSSPDSFRNDQAQTEEMIACSIMELICSFGTVIKKEKQLDVLKTKFNVDWIDIVEKTTVFASAYNITGLIDSCKKATKHLKNVKEGKVLPYKPRPLPEILKRVEEPEIVVIDAVSPQIVNIASNGSAKAATSAPQNVMKMKIQSKTRDELNKNFSNNDQQQNESSNRGLNSNRSGATSSSGGGLSHRDSASGTGRVSSQHKSGSGGSNPRNSGSAKAGGASSTSSTGEWGGVQSSPPKTSKSGEWRDAPGTTRSGRWGSSQSSGGGGRAKFGDVGWGSDQGRDGGWGEYRNTSDPPHSAVRDTSNYSSTNKQMPSSAEKRKPDISTMNYGALLVNKVDLSSSPSKGVDGLSDLPGYSSWKTSTYNPGDRSKESNNTHSKNSYSLNKVDLNDTSSKGVDGLADLPGYAPWRNVAKGFSKDSGSIRSKSSHSLNKVDINDDSSKGVDGFADLPGYAPWKSANYDYNSLNSKGPSRNISQQFDRKRNDRSSDYENHGGNKRRRVEDTTPSDRWGTQSSRPSVGRGRGRDRTLPAWMSKRDNVSDNVTGVQPVVRTSTNPTNILNSLGSNSSAQVSRGRGRGRTLPAWMTNNDSDNASGDSRPRESNESMLNSASSNTGRAKTNTNNFTRGSTTNDSSTRFTGESMGRGRGRDRTKPAWMTKQDALSKPVPADQNYSKTTPTTQVPVQQSSTRKSNAYDPSSLDSRGRGRGRTLPAWMTKQDASAVPKLAQPDVRRASSHVGASNTRQHYNDRISSNLNSRSDAGSFQGRGRGRGKEQTLPAWMTKK